MSLKIIIGNFIAKNLVAIHTGSVATKIKGAFLLATSISPIAFVVNEVTNWTVTNSAYVEFVLLAIILDHILGSLIHLLVKKDFTFYENIKGLLVKTGLVVAVGLLFEGMGAIVKGESIIEDYITIVLRLLVFMYPAGSAFMNSSIITGGKFPPIGFLKKITRFQENLDLGEFKGK